MIHFKYQRNPVPLSVRNHRGTTTRVTPSFSPMHASAAAVGSLDRAFSHYQAALRPAPIGSSGRRACIPRTVPAAGRSNSSWRARAAAAQAALPQHDGFVNGVYHAFMVVRCVMRRACGGSSSPDMQRTGITPGDAASSATSTPFHRRDYELDQFSVVNNAHYAAYAQHARHQALAAVGLAVESFQEEGVLMVGSWGLFHAPAHAIHLLPASPAAMRARCETRMATSLEVQCWLGSGGGGLKAHMRSREFP